MNTENQKRFFIHLPGMVYAVTEYGKNKREAVNNFKKKNDLSRMPKGFSIWAA
jgi:hypothetical protein